ncbi:type II secretion system protein [Pseudomonas putida]
MKEIRTKSQIGFTLIEILAAISILAIGFAVAVGVIKTAFSLLVKDEALTRLALEGRSIFDEQARLNLEVGHSQGTSNDIAWVLDITLDHSEGPVRVLRESLLVTDQEYSVRFTTLHIERKR